SASPSMTEIRRMIRDMWCFLVRTGRRASRAVCWTDCRGSPARWRQICGCRTGHDPAATRVLQQGLRPPDRPGFLRRMPDWRDPASASDLLRPARNGPTRPAHDPETDPGLARWRPARTATRAAARLSTMPAAAY